MTEWRNDTKPDRCNIAQRYKNMIHIILLLSKIEGCEPNINTQCWKLQCLSKSIWDQKGAAGNEYLQCQIENNNNNNNNKLTAWMIQAS
jgi:hypothetical protein